jgi:hypothetical protein
VGVHSDQKLEDESWGHALGDVIVDGENVEKIIDEPI